MLLHLEDAVRQWHSKVSIRTVDADVVVQAITAAQHLYISELWVAFGVGKPYDFLLLMRLPVMCHMCLLPARASEQGNVIGSVRILYILNIQPFRVEYRYILYPR